MYRQRWHSCYHRHIMKHSVQYVLDALIYIYLQTIFLYHRCYRIGTDGKLSWKFLILYRYGRLLPIDYYQHCILNAAIMLSRLWLLWSGCAFSTRPFQLGITCCRLRAMFSWCVKVCRGTPISFDSAGRQWHSGLSGVVWDLKKNCEIKWRE